jgi:hypothetical protein
MLLALQLLTVAGQPSMVTVPVVVPKLLPAIVTSDPTGPNVGVRLEILGGPGFTVWVSVDDMLAL